MSNSIWPPQSGKRREYIKRELAALNKTELSVHARTNYLLTVMIRLLGDTFDELDERMTELGIPQTKGPDDG